MIAENQVYDYLKNLQEQVPSELTQLCAEFPSLYERKLWHQLTESSLLFINNPASSPFRISFYKNFVVDWEKHMNKIKLVSFSLAAAKMFKVSHPPPSPTLLLSFLIDLKEADEFMGQISEKVNSEETKEAYILSKLEQAHFKLVLNDIDSAQLILKEADQVLLKLNKIEPIVYAGYYRVSADFYKVKANFGQYYKNALLLLSCIKLDDLTLDEKLERTRDLAIAALLSESIYNFGDLLSHPIINVLAESSQNWMFELLSAFNNGDISKLDQLTPKFQEQPLLLQHLPFLHQKIRLMALVEAAFKRQGSSNENDQLMTFEKLAFETKLPVGDIEHLVMNALSLGLVDGKIDEIERTIDFTWVQPRYLDKKQIESMCSRLESWSHRATTVADGMDSYIANSFSLAE
ncbi:putative 26S proteasome regulatory subunit rpn9 [Smittium culicis]|uniref:Putative 26S proteasome regulatory subunit rpn9 n=1 Tax=Smittium culicis TaxID=133412 RepID=A0A1R1Y3C4_9FUNG|nr:putative 26S proteasome regulatory subunit rpn9 [Smittium culicis]